MLGVVRGRVGYWWRFLAFADAGVFVVGGGSGRRGRLGLAGSGGVVAARCGECAAASAPA